MGLHRVTFYRICNGTYENCDMRIRWENAACRDPIFYESGARGDLEAWGVTP